MKKILLFAIILVIGGVFVKAQNAESIISKTISQYNKSGGISANYQLSSNQGRDFGSIIMNGKMFRILSDNLKCWYNGKTMWSYSSASGEVNVTNPTNDDLQMTNPYSVAMSVKSSYNATLISKTGNKYVLKLVPKKNNSNVSQIILTVSNKYFIEKANITMRNRTSANISITNYKVGGNYNGTVFVYNNKMVPRGTHVVDLR